MGDGFYIRVKMKTFDMNNCSQMDNLTEGFYCEITTQLRVGEIPWAFRDNVHVFILKPFNKIDISFGCSSPNFCTIAPGWMEYGGINLVFHTKLRTWPHNRNVKNR